ncbi:putative zinc finger protein [Podospora australis]|uniref:Zinc finger protein n=1 Tax=Podospora australis TaxID=1536484 RepID=A0AAN7AHJ8_9PEZI|nr:putative zinc finger protein [Podospora australis]
MGKKKRGHPDVEELLSRPWCYYCERDFEDLKLLISHQKAKHFKCDRCGKRLNTAGGLSVHMNQVHKENLDRVENALTHRQGLDIEIFGMEGVPEDVIAQHNQRIIQNFYTAQAERQAVTGNPPRGLSGGQGPAKKIKVETPEEIKKRLADHRAKVAAAKAAAANGTAPPVVTAPVAGQSPAQGVSLTNFHNHVLSFSPSSYPRRGPARSSNSPINNQTSPFPPPQPGFPYPPTGVPAYPPVAQTYPPTTYPPGAAPGAFGTLPARPPSGSAVPGAPSALPQRPNYAYPGAGPTGDELAAGAAPGARGDDIDQLIRMAEAGIKPAKGAEETGAGEKKKKGMRMVYDDSEISPEEKMAFLPRYRWVEETAA